MKKFDREEENEEFIKFIEKKCEGASAPLNQSEISREFIASGKTIRANRTLLGLIVNYRQSQSIRLIKDEKKKVQILFCLGATIDEDLMKELEEHARVKLDEDRKITEYVAHDGSFTLKGHHGHDKKEENEEFIKFIEKKCAETRAPLNLSEIIRGFKKIYKTERKPERFQKLIFNYKKTLRLIKDEKKRAERLFCLSATIDEDLMKELEEHARVKLDHDKRITEYVAHDGSFSLKGYHGQWCKKKSYYDERRRTIIAMTNGAAANGEGPSAPKKPCSSGSYHASQFPTTSTYRLPPMHHGERDPGYFVGGQWYPAIPVGQTGRPLSPNRVLYKAPRTKQCAAPGQFAATRSTQPPVVSIEEKLPVTATQIFPPEYDEDFNIKQEIPEEPDLEVTPIKNKSWEIPVEVKPELQDFEEQEPQRNEAPGEKTLTLATRKKLLESFATLIEVLGLPYHSNNIEEMIQAITSYETSGNNESPELKKVSIRNLNFSLGYSVMSVQENVGDEVKNEEVTSLREYLIRFQFMIVSLRMVEFEEIKKQLKEALDELRGRDVMIPVSKILASLNIILNVLIPK